MRDVKLVVEIENVAWEICSRHRSFDNLCHTWRAKLIEKTTKSRSVRTHLDQVTLTEYDSGVT
jgi:hypothetical protein